MGIAFLALALVARAARAVDTYVAAETSYVSWASQALDARLAEAIQTSIVTQAGAATNFYLGADAPWATAAGRDAVAHALYAHMTSVDASVYHLWAAFEDGGFLGYYNEGVLLNGSVAQGFMANASWACGAYGVGAPCREYFAVDRVAGGRAATFDAADYDARTRSSLLLHLPSNKVISLFAPPWAASAVASTSGPAPRTRARRRSATACWPTSRRPWSPARWR